MSGLKGWLVTPDKLVVVGYGRDGEAVSVLPVTRVEDLKSVGEGQWRGFVSVRGGGGGVGIGFEGSRVEVGMVEGVQRGGSWKHKRRHQ
jgi:hypothetical protein